jgi:hypothetical protein
MEWREYVAVSCLGKASIVELCNKKEILDTDGKYIAERETYLFTIGEDGTLTIKNLYDKRPYHHVYFNISNPNGYKIEVTYKPYNDPPFYTGTDKVKNGFEVPWCFTDADVYDSPSQYLWTCVIRVYTPRPCHESCNGFCPTGQVCEKNSSGTYQCVAACTDCGGKCNVQNCARDQLCELVNGSYECVKIPCTKCGGTCNLPCPNGQQCQYSPNGYSCVTIPSTCVTCGGTCNGSCPGGMVCRDGPQGFECVSSQVPDCGECRVNCEGTCPAGYECAYNQALKTFECIPSCKECSGDCNGPCETGTCQEGPNGYECVTGPCGTCQGDCNGICPSGSECILDENGIYQCVPAKPVETTQPFYKTWWFITLMVVLGVLILGLILFFLLHKKTVPAKVPPNTVPKKIPTATVPTATVPKKASTATVPTTTVPTATVSAAAPIATVSAAVPIVTIPEIPVTVPTLSQAGPSFEIK